MNKIANQRVFDEALKHIREQGKPSFVIHEDRCLYKSPEGLGCAFAPCIKTYLPEMENSYASDLLECYPDNIHEWAQDCNRALADHIQRAHDEAARSMKTNSRSFMDIFESNMQEVRKIHAGQLI